MRAAATGLASLQLEGENAALLQSPAACTEAERANKFVTVK
jgi:hypothetical protein